MPPAADYYEILHVHPDAPLEIIKASYRTLMQRLRAHPDLGGDAGKAAVINEAYETLCDAHRRKAYDEKRQRVHSVPSAPAVTPRAGTCAFCAEPATPAADCRRCGAPLTPLRRDDAAHGARTLQRMPRRQAVRLQSGWPCQSASARTRDISTQGMLIESRSQLGLGQILLVECEACRAVARVVHCRVEGGLHVAGLEFVTVTFARMRGTFVSATA